jgi:fructose-1-phosphate kinase PfkB-like protein
LDDDAKLLDAMRGLNTRGAQWVAITHGAAAVWLTSATHAYRFDTLKVDDVVNPLGCGDSLAAGIAWAVRAGRNMVDAVRLGIAAAAQNVRRLDTGRIDPALADRQAAEVRVEEI